MGVTGEGGGAGGMQRGIPEGCDGGEEIVLLPLDELPRRGPGVFDVLRGPGQHRQVVDVRVVPLHVRGGVMAVVPERAHKPVARQSWRGSNPRGGQEQSPPTHSF